MIFDKFGRMFYWKNIQDHLIKIYLHGYKAVGICSCNDHLLGFFLKSGHASLLQLNLLQL